MAKQEAMFNTLKLGTKFSALLLLVFLIGSCIGGAVLSNVLLRKAETQVAERGTVLLETISSVRDYTNQQVTPLLSANQGAEDFAPEQVPAYAARRVFEILHQQKAYQDLAYKQAMLNPTNPADQADPFEVALIQKFRQDSATSSLSGFRQLDQQGRMFYSARPIAIKNPTCLRCHSVPEKAPAAMLRIYGDKNGFNWKLNEVLGSQVVYVPAETVFQNSHRAFTAIMGIFLGLFAIATLLTNALLKPTVLQPVQRLANVSQRLTAGNLTAEEARKLEHPHGLAAVATRGDELGQLARVFQTMVREVISREAALKQRVRELKIEIDHVKRAKEVAQITESDYFQELQKKARTYRKRSPQSDDRASNRPEPPEPPV